MEHQTYGDKKIKKRLKDFWKKLDIIKGCKSNEEEHRGNIQILTLLNQTSKFKLQLSLNVSNIQMDIQIYFPFLHFLIKQAEESGLA